MRDVLMHLEALLVRQHGQLGSLSFVTRDLRGGLEAAGTQLIVARFVDERGRRQLVSLVAKQLVGRGVREAAVYRHVLAAQQGVVAPRLLGSARVDTERTVLFLERVRRISTWPWRDFSMSERVLTQVARLHTTASRSLEAVPAWEYERELRASANQALELLERGRSESALRPLARGLPWTRRLVQSLPRVRRELLQGALGTSMLHGDLHSGNVIMRRRRQEIEPVFLDWGRARLGSPLEDVASWLQSLGHWEPEARRRHDALLVRYLRAASHSERLTRELRESYWLASASNVLAGALSYHLQRTRAARNEAERANAARAVCDGLRVLRRADAVWS